MPATRDCIRFQLDIDRRSLKRLALVAGTFVFLAGGAALAALPHSFEDGQVLTAAHLNQNFSHLEARVVPPGTIVAFAGEAPPEGWLACDGSSVVRTSYPALFAAIGTGWGSPSTSSFNLPDLRGRFLRGVDSGSNRDPDRATRTASQPGGNTGDKVGSLQADELEAHTHLYQFGAWEKIPHPSNWDVNFHSFWINHAPTATEPAGGNETRPKNAAVSYIIKH